MQKKQISFLKYVGAMYRHGFKSQWEYRASFFSQLFGMFLNNLLWTFFWSYFYASFGTGGQWGREETLILWSSVTFSFGVTMGLFGNITRLPSMIAQGEIDNYLLLPRAVLPQIIFSRINPISLGDLAFGPVLFVIFFVPDIELASLYFLSGLFSSLIFLGFHILVSSLSFFLGPSEQLSAQAGVTLVHFSLYPMHIFDGWMKWVLYSVVPAGFISSFPVAIIQQRDWSLLGALGVVGALCVGLGTIVFYAGLKRYESGNLMIMRD